MFIHSSRRLKSIRETDELLPFPKSKLPISCEGEKFTTEFLTPDYQGRHDQIRGPHLSLYSESVVVITSRTNSKVVGYLIDTNFTNLDYFYQGGYMLAIPKSYLAPVRRLKQGKIEKMVEKNRFFSFHNRPFLLENRVGSADKNGEYILTNGSKVVGYLIRGEYFNMWRLD